MLYMYSIRSILLDMNYIPARGHDIATPGYTPWTWLPRRDPSLRAVCKKAILRPTRGVLCQRPPMEVIDP
jgi:hypothetical protein